MYELLIHTFISPLYRVCLFLYIDMMAFVIDRKVLSKVDCCIKPQEGITFYFILIFDQVTDSYKAHLSSSATYFLQNFASYGS